MWQASGMAPLNKYCYQNHSGSKKLNGSEEKKRTVFRLVEVFFCFCFLRTFRLVEVNRTSADVLPGEGEGHFSHCPRA
jgi:hypothetical protein